MLAVGSGNRRERGDVTKFEDDCARNPNPTTRDGKFNWVADPDGVFYEEWKAYAQADALKANNPLKTNPRLRAGVFPV